MYMMHRLMQLYTKKSGRINGKECQIVMLDPFNPKNEAGADIDEAIKEGKRIILFVHAFLTDTVFDQIKYRTPCYSAK